MRRDERGAGGARGSAAGGGSAPTITSEPGPGAPAGPSRLYRLRTPHPPAEALAALATAVGDWGGEWTPGNESGGELRLPVTAGLRRGLLEARASAAGTMAGSVVVIEVVTAQWAIQRTAVALLAGAAVPGLAAMLWPFVPALAHLVPLGLVLGAASWLAILARLRHQGPAELLAEVEAALEQATPVEEPPPPVAPR